MSISVHSEARAYNQWLVTLGCRPLPVCNEVECDCWRLYKVPEETDDQHEYWDPRTGAYQAEIRAFIADYVAKANIVG